MKAQNGYKAGVSKPDINIDVLHQWLGARLGEPITDVQPLDGGFWSSAFAFRADTRELVIRFNPDPSGFLIDAKAMQFENLPIPKVLDIGEGLGFHYAISERHYGTFLELFEDNPTEAAKKLISSLANQDTPKVANVNWFEEDQSQTYAWRSWLLDSLYRAQDSVTSSHPAITLSRCLEILEHHADDIPERRDLVHGDLLHQNVLVSETGDIETIFSWKCSALGDFLFDVAWLGIWIPWHPALQHVDFGSRFLGDLSVPSDALENATLRRYLYTLQIGAHHLGWFSSIKDTENLMKMNSYLERAIETGPRD